MADDSRSRGTVVRFDDQKGFGFIKPDDGGEDLFVHHTAIISDGFRSLQQGQTVEFAVALERDRTKAVDVTPLGGGSVDRPRRDSRGGGYGFGSRGGGGGGACYNCGEDGHLARDCRGGGGTGGGGGGGGVCFSCGLPGHLARDCDQGGGGGGRGSGGYGGGRGGYGGGGGGGSCYSCGGQGHMARDCPSGGGGGYGGRFGGSSGGGGGGSYGGRFGGGSAGGGNCYNCGESGHFARECTGNRGRA